MMSLADLYYGGGLVPGGQQREPSLQDDMASVYGGVADRLKRQYRVGQRDQLTPEMQDVANNPGLPMLAGAADPFGIAQFVAPDSDFAQMQSRDGVASTFGSLLTGGPAIKGLGLAAQGVNAAAQAAPRTLASFLAGLGATASTAADAPTAEAQRAKRNRRNQAPAPEQPSAAEQEVLSAIGDDVRLKAMYAQIKNLERKGATGIPGVGSAGSNQARSEFRQQADNLRGELFQALADKQASEQPYSKTVLGQYHPYMQLGLPLAAGLATRGAQNVFMNQGAKALQRGIDGYNRSTRGSLMSGFRPLSQTDQVRRAENVASLTRGLTPETGKSLGRKTAETIGENALPVVAGGAVGAELAVLPHQYNLSNTPPGSPAYETAKQFVGSPEQIAQAMAMGGLVGGVSGFTGGHLAGLTPLARMRAPIEEGQAIAKTLTPEGAMAAQNYSRTRAASLQGDAIEAGMQRQIADARRRPSSLQAPEFPPQGPRGDLLEPPDVPLGGGGPKQPPDPPRGTQPGNDPPKGGNQPKSKTSYDPLVHTPIASDYINETLRAGQQLPPGRDIATELAGRFEAAGVPAVSKSNLSSRAGATSTAINAGASPAGVLGQPGFLSVPAGITVGGAAASDPNADLNGNGIPDLIEEFLGLLPRAPYPY